MGAALAVVDRREDLRTMAHDALDTWLDQVEAGTAKAPTLREIALFSGHEGHIKFLKLLVGAGVPSSPSVAKGSNQGCRQASHFDKPTFLFAGELPRSRARDGARPIMQ